MRDRFALQGEARWSTQGRSIFIDPLCDTGTKTLPAEARPVRGGGGGYERKLAFTAGSARVMSAQIPMKMLR